MQWDVHNAFDARSQCNPDRRPGPTAQASDNAPTAAECAAPDTQKRMNDCAYEDFLAASAGYAEGNKAVSDKLSGKQRELFRRTQKAWITYRTAACDFQSSAKYADREKVFHHDGLCGWDRMQWNVHNAFDARCQCNPDRRPGPTAQASDDAPS